MSETANTGADFAGRLQQARRALEATGADLLLATPGTNFRYLTGISAQRMERLIAFGLTRQGEAFLVCPAFEKDNMRRDLKDAEVITWEETGDPFAVLADVVGRAGGDAIRIALEPTTWFWMAERIRATLPQAEIRDAAAIFEGLRTRKMADETGAIRRAADVAENAACKARLHLREGMTELDACEILNDLVKGCCSELEALVQFGANSAIPHATAGSRTLRRDDMVLFDLCVQVDGYFCDITRMTCFGDASREMKEIYAVVLEAQQAAIEMIRPGVECQAADRAARRVIERAGYGDFFLHRTGHGLGMDIHEAPWLVEGNTQKLEVGNVVTVEPGIYLAGRFGVRIEDDVLVTAGGPEVLTDGQPSLIETP